MVGICVSAVAPVYDSPFSTAHVVRPENVLSHVVGVGVVVAVGVVVVVGVGVVVVVGVGVVVVVGVGVVVVVGTVHVVDPRTVAYDPEAQSTHAELPGAGLC